MIKLENHLGTIEISQEYFAGLIGKITAECFGVAGMSVTNPAQTVFSFLFKRDCPDKGVRVREVMGKLVVDIHIVVTYGVNISEIVKSIVHKVRYNVETITGFTVANVNVFVDDIRPE